MTSACSLWFWANIMLLLLLICKRPKYEVIQVDCHVLSDNTAEASVIHTWIHRYTFLSPAQTVLCAKIQTAFTVLLATTSYYLSFSWLFKWPQWLKVRMAFLQFLRFPEIRQTFQLHVSSSLQAHLPASVNQEEQRVLQWKWVHNSLVFFLKALTATACNILSIGNS